MLRKNQKIARNVTMKRIIVEHLFEKWELSEDNLSKYYYRKFANAGKEKYLTDFKHYTAYYLKNRK